MANDAAEYLARKHMTQQVRQAAIIQAALSRLWDEVIDPNDLTRSFARFRERAAVIIGGGQVLSARKADEYYRVLLEFKGLDPSDITGLAPRVGNPGHTKSSLSAATAKALARAERLRRQGYSPAEALAAAKSNMLGSAKRHILNTSRNRLTDLSRAHRKLKGWARVSDGNPCGFCAMLVGRGPVYSSDTVGFEAHDRCGCSVRLVTFDEADGGWSIEARAYRDAYNDGLLDVRTGSRRRTGTGKTNNLSSARWIDGYTADEWLAEWLRLHALAA